MTDKELDDLFQNKLSGHRMPVPPGMWDRVNPQEDKRRRGAFLWWSLLGTAAFFIITGAAVWLYRAPAQNVRTTEVKQTKTGAQKSSAEHKTALSKQQDSTINQAVTSGINHESSSSQTTSVNNKTSRRNRDFYTSQNKAGHQVATSVTTTSELQNKASIDAGNNITSSQNDTRLNNTDNDQSTATTRGNSNTQSNNPTASLEPEKTTASSGNQPIASVQKPDSTHTVSVNDPATQTAKATTVKVKKIHGEKTPALEFMVAGYGDSRNVYDKTSQLRAGGVVTFGPINTKEKALMHSISITARIDKPLTRNLSVKTGLQFLRTRQNISYSYETVNQTMSVNSLNNSDTTIFARLQSKQSEVKGIYNSLGIPVLVSYHTNAAKASIGATAGVVVNVLSWYGGRVPDAGNSQIVSAKKVFRTHTGTSLYAGITAAKQIGSFQLFAEPHIQYTLSSITKNSASFRQKITGYGFGIGIRKTIGK